MAEYTFVTGQMRLKTVYVTYTHSPGLENVMPCPNTRATLGNRVNNQELWEATKGVRCPWPPWESVLGLSHSAGWQEMKQLLRDKQGLSL